MHAPIFSGRGDQGLSFVLENDRRRRELTRASRVPTLHRQSFRIERDQRVGRFASAPGRNIERSVSTEDRAGYACDVRFPGRDLFGDEIERPYSVRYPAAVSFGDDVGDVVNDYQPVGVGVRRQEFYGRLV